MNWYDLMLSVLFILFGGIVITIEIRNGGYRNLKNWGDIQLLFGGIIFLFGGILYLIQSLAQ